MADPKQKLVKVDDGIVAFPGDLPDEHVVNAIKLFRAKQKFPNSQYAKPGPYNLKINVENIPIDPKDFIAPVRAETIFVAPRPPRV